MGSTVQITEITVAGAELTIVKATRCSLSEILAILEMVAVGFLSLADSELNTV